MNPNVKNKYLVYITIRAEIAAPQDKPIHEVIEELEQESNYEIGSTENVNVVNTTWTETSVR